jgi:four helix bundle protein
VIDLSAVRRLCLDAEMNVKSFRDLIVWHRSIELSVAVYEFTAGFPKEEMFGLKSQLRRASVSVASNIAEGSGRRSTGEFLQFLGMDRGSNAEVQTQLVISDKLGFGTADGRKRCDQLATEVSKMLPSLMHSLESSAGLSLRH